MTAPKVAFGVVYPNEVPVSFLHSWTNLLMFDVANWGMLMHGPGLISVRCGTDGLVQARNKVVEQFLSTDGEWLLWCDSDMGFSPQDAYKLVGTADPVARPIVGGLCFASREVADDHMGGYRTVPTPTIFQMGEYQGVPRPVAGNMYPVNSLIRVVATGSAFIVIHRSVFEKIGGGWYDRITDAAGPMGEDVSFCLRAEAVGFPVHVYTGARTTHFKPQWVQEADYWKAIVPPPATEETAVIVPVMGRPQNAEPFMRSLRASTGLAHVTAVWSAGDEETAKAWIAAGADQVLEADGPSFARKVNYARQHTDEPWLFLVGDDVRFRPGWLDHAQHVGNTWGAHVVGTNDLANQKVLAGEHATHMLIRRSYVEEVGASWDGPGVVCHEGYRHWFVDDEIVAAAKQRGVWSMALGSLVEHLHPVFGKGTDDDVYQLGQSHADADGEVFKQRCETYM